MKITNKTKNTVLAQDTIVADKLFSRLKGLLGEKGLAKGSALIITPCDSIHTFFMGFSIDAVFVDKAGRVLKVVSNIKPFRLSGIYFNARSVVELPAGTIQATLTSTGDTLLFE